MRLAIFGAGGAVGQRVVEEATGRGHEVTAVHRAPPADGRAGARILAGDVRDPLPVLRGRDHDAVISAVGAGPTGPAPDYAVYLDAARALVAAARELGDAAPRLVVVGGAGSLEAAPGVLHVNTAHFPAEFREEALAQARALEYYRTVADVSWTYISPAALLEPGARTGSYRVGGDRLLVDGEGRSWISMEDYAVALVDEAERPRQGGRRVSVAH